MKNLKTLFVFLCLLVGTNSIFAILPEERQAQLAVKEYLEKQRYNPQIDDTDNSVNFYRSEKIKGNNKDILFWITFEKVQDGVLYTLHRKPIKMESENSSPEENARRIENSVVAANLLNNKTPFKTFVNVSKVEFVYPVCSPTPADYVRMLPYLIKSMSDIEGKYDECHRRAKVINDSIHDYWKNFDPTALVIPQNKEVMAKVNPNISITGVDFRVVDDNGNIISDYGNNIRKADIKFIQPRIKVSSTREGNYGIGMLITTPDGKRLLSSPTAKLTSVTNVEVKKKAAEVELNGFGSVDGAYWVPGEYKVTFYENNIPVKETSFNVL